MAGLVIVVLMITGLISVTTIRELEKQGLSFAGPRGFTQNTRGHTVKLQVESERVWT